MLPKWKLKYVELKITTPLGLANDITRTCVGCTTKYELTLHRFRKNAFFIICRGYERYSRFFWFFSIYTGVWSHISSSREIRSYVKGHGKVESRYLSRKTIVNFFFKRQLDYAWQFRVFGAADSLFSLRQDVLMYHEKTVVNWISAYVV